MYGPLFCVIQACFIPIEIQESLTVRGGYVPENCREWQNRERRDVNPMRIVGLRSKIVNSRDRNAYKIENMSIKLT